MNKINIVYYKSTIGDLILGSFKDKICMVDFRYRRMRATVDKRLQVGLNAEYIEKDSNIIKTLILQIDEFLKGNRKKFDIDIITIGTDFQKKVWNELLKIEYGETTSYLDLAKRINNDKAVRAVASANGANSIGLIIPCHRVIESNGGLGGYAGGISIKKRILKMEIENTPLTDIEKYNFIGHKNIKYNYRFITGVKTTGIYCLPSCYAKKPNYENVIFYDTKKEAIKYGLRACKVCKP
jgi:methylated-DNA-[protein]-cysteine S-methyltransferase